DDNCPRCPTNPFLVVHSHDVAGALQLAINLLLGGAMVVTVVLLVRKVRGASAVTRRAVTPVLLTSAIAFLLLIPAVVGVNTDGVPVLGTAGGIAFAAIPVAFLLGLLRTRLHRGAIAGLVVELGSLPSPGKLRAAIARCLGDPSLELAFWLPGS